jgi:23S rRNA pseudouridine1911/1915/1917 synthase
MAALPSAATITNMRAVYNRAVTATPVSPRGPSWTVSSDSSGVRLDKFLAAADRIGSRGRVVEYIRKGKLFLNGSEVRLRDAGRLVHLGDVLQFWEDRPGSSRRRRGSLAGGTLAIVYEDDDVIVVNKPAGLLAVPLAQRPDAPSVQGHLEAHLRTRRRPPLVVHRIDRDTSGLVVFAKTARAQEALKADFERREPERVYVAVLYGHLAPARGTWRDHLKWDSSALLQKQAHPREAYGKEAISHYAVLEELDGASLVEIRLETGKRNQIRIQARLHGHTLVGERLYVHGPGESRPIVFPRQALHAARLSFTHPRTGRLMEFEAPLPGDLSALISQLQIK